MIGINGCELLELDKDELGEYSSSILYLVNKSFNKPVYKKTVSLKNRSTSPT